MNSWSLLKDDGLMEQKLKNLIAWYSTHTTLVLLLGFVMTLISVGLATQLTIESEFERLLPEDAPSVQGLEQLDKTYGKTIDRLSILIQSKDAEQNKRILSAVKERFIQDPNVISINTQRPVEFFENQRMLYIDRSDLETISERIKKRIKWERKNANPLFASLNNKKPSTDVSDVTKKYEDKYNKQRYFANADGTIVMMYLELKFSSQKFDHTEVFLPATQKKLDAISKNFKDAKILLTGRYIKRLEQRDATMNDLTKGTSIALVLIVVFLGMYFRGILSPLLVSIPLLAGTSWAFGWAYLIFGSLNMLTGFLGSVLLGLGIDYGIHLVSMYREARRTMGAQEAVLSSFNSAGRASLYAGLTTLVALGSLATSSFLAFYEFGLLSLGGLTLILFSYATILPCLLLSTAGTRFDIGQDLSFKDKAMHKSAFSKKFTNTARTISLVLILTTLPICYLGFDKIAFEYDFHNIMPKELPSMNRDQLVAQVESTWRTPGIVLVEDRAHAKLVQKTLLDRLKKYPKKQASLLRQVLTAYDLLPKNQQEKIKILKNLRNKFEKLPTRILKQKDELGDFYKELVRITDAGVLTVHHLPKDLTRIFTRQDDPQKDVVLIFPNGAIHDARDAVAYSNMIDLLPNKNGQRTLRPISEESLMRDILERVTKDFRWMFGLSVAGIILITLIAFRSLPGLSITLLTLASGIIMTLSLIGLAGIKFNFINVIIFPIWLGLGVDAIYHMMIRLEDSPGDRSAFMHTISAVFAAFSTTMIGFGSLTISHTRGLASLGYDALIGLGVMFIFSVAIQLLFLHKKHIQEDY